MDQNPVDVVLFARQPLFESTGRVFGYELLFRRPDGTGWPIEDEVQATAHVVVASFADMGLGEATSGRKAWINVPREFLLTPEVEVLPRQRVVLELLERGEVDEELIARAEQLAGDGYELALDDFEWRDELEPLVRCASFVKLDIRALGIAGVAAHCRRLSAFDVEIVAEKVETAAEREACTRLGIGIFQGYYFERPSLVRGRPAPSGNMAGLSLATCLSVDATFEEVEAVVRSDAGLSVRLLRYVNSAAVSLRNSVSSLRQTLMLVGTNTVRQWLLLVVLSGFAKGNHELLRSGLVRAHICELLAREYKCHPETAFVVGLLSVCDALLDRPMQEVVDDLPLDDDIRDALVDHRGRLGMLLDLAIRVQRGELGANESATRAASEAIAWADGQVASLVGEPAELVAA